MNGAPLRLLNDNPAEVSVVAPVQLLPDAPIVKMALPHPCIYGQGIGYLKHFLVSKDFDTFSFIWGKLYRALLSAAPRGALVVDVGANMGFYSVWPAALGANVVSFELQTRRAEALRLTAQANGWSGTRMTVHNVALGSQADLGYSVACDQSGLVGKGPEALDQPGECRFVKTPPPGAPPAPGLVPFATVDSLVPPEGEVYLLKIDCDGCEPKAVQGMEGVLRRTRFALVEVGGPQPWVAELCRRYKPRVFVTFFGVMPGAPQACHHFQGLDVAEYSRSLETLGQQLVASQRDGVPAHFVRGGIDRLYAHMMERCDRGRKLSVDLLLDFRRTHPES